MARTFSPLIWVWILKWLAPGAISLMRHAEMGSYILDNGGVESALGIVGVESRETGTGDMGDTATGFYVAQ